MEQFSQEELNNLIVLINRSNITGQESEHVAMLKQKIIGLITPKKDDKSIEEVEKVEN